MKTNDNSLNSPRIRFNWGYHDAVQCVENKWDETGHCFAGNLGKCVTPQHVLEFHFDQNYAKGWAFGYRDAKAGQQKQSSEPAWLTFQEHGIEVAL
jgi:hypothetical protein